MGDLMFTGTDLQGISLPRAGGSREWSSIRVAQLHGNRSVQGEDACWRDWGPYLIIAAQWHWCEA